MLQNKVSDPAGAYNILKQIIPRIDDPYKERIFVAIQDGNFYIERIITIGSSSITFCSTELEIRTLYVSPEFANSVSGSGLHSSFLRAFALTPTVMLFFEVFPKIRYSFFRRGSRRGQHIRVYRSYQRLKEARKGIPIIISE